MKKRLRKKLHVGEFQELGFKAVGSLADYPDEQGIDRLFDDWIDFIESHGFCCGGSFSGRAREFRFYIERSPRSCTDEDREAVLDWLSTRPEVEGAEVGNLEDNWYPKNAD